MIPAGYPAKRIVNKSAGVNMLRKKRSLVIILIVISILSVVAFWLFIFSLPTADYEVVPLSLDWDSTCRVSAINNKGQIAGTIKKESTGFLWDEANGPVYFGGDSVAIQFTMDINDRGQVVGGCVEKGNQNDYTKTKAFIWDKKTGLMKIPGLEGGKSSALAINNYGNVAGIITTYKNGTEEIESNRLFVWDAGNGTTISDKFAPAFVSGINDIGQIAGRVKVNNKFNGFLFDSLSGELSIFGNDIAVLDLDDKGCVWGITKLEYFKWSQESGLELLGSFGYDSLIYCRTNGSIFMGQGMNSPLMIGQLIVGNTKGYNFLGDEQGKIFSLDRLFSRQQELYPEDINDEGWIVGTIEKHSGTNLIQVYPVLIKPKTNKH